MPLVRATMECQRALHPGPSGLRAYDTESRTFSRSIGRGLYSLLSYRKDEVIADFIGVYRTKAEHNQLCIRQPQRKGYAVAYTNDIVLDCFDHFTMGLDVASLSNCPRGCFNTATHAKAVSNAYLSIHHSIDDINARRVCLKAGTTRNGGRACPRQFFIPAGTEILWDYNDKDYDYERPPYHPIS